MGDGMSKPIPCVYCGGNCPYTDYTKCDACNSVLRIAGKERTKAECLARAAFERRAAEHSNCPIIARGHTNAGNAYTQLSEVKP